MSGILLKIMSVNDLQVKWLKIRGETIFVVLSTDGFQLYDAEVTEIKFSHGCKVSGNGKGITTTTTTNQQYQSKNICNQNLEYSVGACVVKDEYLCIGSGTGMVWIFASNEDNTDFRVMDRIYAHDHALKYLDAYGDYMVSTSHDTVYFWQFDMKQFRILRKIVVPG